MNKFKFLLLLTGFVFVSSHLMGQDIKNDINNFLENPSASKATDFSNQELVDLYTGKISIPLSIFSVEDKDLKVPIGLFYNTDGIKVRDHASWVGLGWQLGVGGSIKRELRGNPDEHNTCGRFVNLIEAINYHDNPGFVIDDYVTRLKNGTYQCPASYTDNCQGFCEYEAARMIANNIYSPYPNVTILCVWGGADTQPDIFHYNLPGSSGSFILDKSGNPQVISGPRDIKIIPAIGPQATSGQWVITSEDGIVHEFPDNSSYSETSRLRTPGKMMVGSPTALTQAQFAALPNNGDPQYGSILELDYTVEWHISKMTSPKSSNDVINFTYQTFGTIQDYTCESQRMDYVRSFHDVYSIGNGDLAYCAMNSAPHIAKSTTANSNRPPAGTVIEVYAQPNYIYWQPRLRTILNPKYLSEIQYAKGKVKFIPGSSFREDMANSKYLNEIQIVDFNNVLVKRILFEYSYFKSGTCTTEDCKRLKLKSFYQLSDLGITNKYKFEYNETVNLPSTTSIEQDYWGYYNTNTTGVFTAPSYRMGQSFTGANRSPDANRMQANILTKVTYPAGGSASFQYEMNKYLSPTYAGFELSIGGLRVKSITKSSDIGAPIVTNFTYVSGSYSSGRIVGNNDNWNSFYQKDHTFYYYTGGSSNVVDRYLYIRRSSGLLFDMLTTKGGNVGYCQVTVAEAGNGKKNYYYTSPESNPDEAGSKILSSFRDVIFNSAPPEFSRTSKDELRGLLTKVEYLNEAGTKVKEIIQDYIENPSQFSQYSNLSMKISPLSQPVGWNPYNGGSTINFGEQDAFEMEFCEVRSYFPRMSSQREIEYFANGSIEKQEQYFRNGTSHLQVTKAISSKSNGKKTVKMSTYSPDYYDNTGFIQDMKSANIINAPIENYVYVTNSDGSNPLIISGQINTYKSGTKGLIDEAYNLETNAPVSLSTFKISNKTLGTTTPESVPNQTFSKDSRYVRTAVVSSYDANGNLTSFNKENDLTTTYLWGYNKSYPIASIQNALPTQVYYEGFEEMTNASVVSFVDGNGRNLAKTGRKIWNSGTYTISFSPPAGSYSMSYCYYDGTKWVFSGVIPFSASIVTSGTKLDEIRVFPSNATMITYTFDPIIGMTSQTDNNGMTTYCEYDSFGRLIITRDNDGNILKHYDYHFKQ